MTRHKWSTGKRSSRTTNSAVVHCVHLADDDIAFTIINPIGRSKTEAGLICMAVIAHKALSAWNGSPCASLQQGFGGGQDTATLRSVSHCQSLNFSRSLLFISFPVEVCGSSATITNASGTCHGAKVCFRKERNSQGSTVRFSFRTTRARGRSCHFGCGTAMTAASRIAGCPTNAFSRSTELIHSRPT